MAVRKTDQMIWLTSGDEDKLSSHNNECHCDILVAKQFPKLERTSLPVRSWTSWGRAAPAVRPAVAERTTKTRHDAPATVEIGDKDRQAFPAAPTCGHSGQSRQMTG
eukprot:scaffold35083_cov37-Prasinocladus_malaysianus.AAC.2